MAHFREPQLLAEIAPCYDWQGEDVAMPDGERSGLVGAENSGRRFVAFLSYSHQDDEIGQWLQKHIENYQVPASLVGRDGPGGPISKRLGKVFRDRADLSAAHDLGTEIRRALEDADALIVLCSPRSCGSKYVHEELRTFKVLGKGERIYAAIVDGEPHAAGKPGWAAADECFPPALIYRLGDDGALSSAPEPNEPIAADFRDGKDGRENGALKIIAGLLGVPLDELVQREKQAERARRLHANAIAAAMTVLAAAALLAGGFAWQQRNVAEQRRIEANDQRVIAEEQRSEAVGQRGRAEYQSQRAEVQRLAAVASEAVASAERDRAREALGRVFETRIWEAMADGQYDRAVRYALALALEQPSQSERARSALASQFMSRAEVLTNFDAHESFVVSVQFAADDRRVLTGSYDGDAILWDVATGRELRRFAGSSFRLTDAQISADGARVVTVPDFLGPGEETTTIWNGETGERVARLSRGVRKIVLSGGGLRLLTTRLGEARAVPAAPREGRGPIEGDVTAIWDARTGNQLSELVGHAGRINDAAFSPDARRVVTASADGAKVWNADTGEMLLDLRGHTGSVDGVVFCPDGAKIATRGADFSVIVWDAATGAILNRLIRADEGLVSAMAFNSDGSELATGSLGGAIHVWRLGPSAGVQASAEHDRAVRAIAFSADDTAVLSASEDGTARLWNARDGAERMRFEGHTDQVAGASITRDGTKVVTASLDGSARLWNARPRASRAWIAHEETAVAFTVSRDRRWIGTGDSKGNVRIWDARNGELQSSAQLSEAVAAIAIAPGGRRLAAVDRGGHARLWSPNGGVVSLQGAINGAGLDFSPDGQLLVSGSWIFNASTGERVAAERDAPGGIGSAVFAPQGDRILFAHAWDGSASIWSLSARRTLLEITADRSFGQAAFDPAGARILTGGESAARIWSAQDGRELLRLPSENRIISRVGFSPDGSDVIVSMVDGMWIWDSHTGRLLTRMPGQDDMLFGAEFGEDGKTIIETSWRGAVRISDASWLARSWDEVRDYACTRRLTRAQRAFSAEERAEDPLIEEVFQRGHAPNRSVCDKAAG